MRAVLATIALAAVAGHAARAGETETSAPRVMSAAESAFREANPGYAERAGAFYEKEYLPQAAAQLAEAAGAGPENRDALREALRAFIHDWLDAYVRGGGHMEGPELARVLELLDARVSDVIGASRRDAYWSWRIGEKGQNALAFLFQYREPRQRPPATPGSGTARKLDEVDRLAATATREATAALLAMLDTRDDAVLVHAARALSDRLPVPDYPGHGCPFTDLRRDQARRNLAATAWSADFAAETRAVARRLLGREATDEAAIGAMMITCVGTVEDMPAVTAAMGRILDRTADIEAPPAYMSFAFDPFLMASQGLLYRGAKPAAEPATTGEVAVYLGAILVFPDARPAGWRERCARWKRHPVPYIRRIAAFALDGR